VQFLDQNGLPDEESLVLSRELIRGGRGLARINGRVIPVSRLRELGRMLINIHGQHEHTLLLEEERQLHLLDSFGGDRVAAAARSTASAYSELQRARQNLADYEENQSQRAESMDRLAYLLEEIGSVEPELGEDERLEAESHLLAHGEKLYQLSSSVYEQLRSGKGIVEQLDSAYGDLRRAAELDPALAELSTRLQSLYYEADDIAAEMVSYRDRISMDPYRLDQVESRIVQLNRLKKKYGGSLEAVLEEYRRSQEEYARLEEISISGEAFQKELQQAEKEYKEAALLLSRARQASAEALGESITQELRSMAMPNAVFSVVLEAHEPSRQGNERAVFVIQPNIGEAPQPVSKIASGGELSRILLGMKAVLAQLDAVPVLIFDEIDTGMSGRALVAVAERLAKVGKSAQTLAVSHAPVMAAAADNQIMIEKHEEDGRTIIEAHSLEYEERVGEIARMIAGDIATPASHQQALDLLQQMHPEN